MWLASFAIWRSVSLETAAFGMTTAEYFRPTSIDRGIHSLCTQA